MPLPHNITLPASPKQNTPCRRVIRSRHLILLGRGRFALPPLARSGSTLGPKGGAVVRVDPTFDRGARWRDYPSAREIGFDAHPRRRRRRSRRSDILIEAPDGATKPPEGRGSSRGRAAFGEEEEAAPEESMEAYSVGRRVGEVLATVVQQRLRRHLLRAVLLSW